MKESNTGMIISETARASGAPNAIAAIRPTANYTNPLYSIASPKAKVNVKCVFNMPKIGDACGLPKTARERTHEPSDHIPVFGFLFV